MTMMKYFLIIFFLLTNFGFTRGKLLDSCNISCGADTALTTSASGICQTPSGNSQWTEDQDTCTGFHTCIATTDNARPAGTGFVNCILMTRPPTQPAIATYDIQTLLTESGTTAATECQGIYGRFTDSTHYYSFMVCDDVGTAGFARLYEQNGALYAGTTSLGTAAGFGNSYSNTVVLKIRNDKKLVLKDGVSLISSTNNDLTGVGTVGAVCGQAQVSGDDCGDTYFFDDFILIEQPRRTMNSALDWIYPSAEADEDVFIRDGRWYMSPIVHKNGVWMPKIETIPEAECSTSNVINPSKPDVLTYANCKNYAVLESDPDIALVYDEGLYPLTPDAIKMLNKIGKPIDPNFNPIYTYAR